MSNLLLFRLKLKFQKLSHISSFSTSLFINSESTPNPNSLKFLPNRVVLPSEFGSGLYIQHTDHKDILRSPLAKQIFQINGIKGVFLGKDFVTVTKNADESWNYLKNLVSLITSVYLFY